MKIGFDAKRAFNNGTGLGNYSRFVITALAHYFPQHEYFLFTPSVKEEFKDFVSGSNISVVAPESLLGKSFPSLWRTYAIADMCKDLGLDVFHGLSNELPVGIERFKGKKVVTIHDLIFLRYPSYYNNIDRYIYTRKFRHACSKADVVAAASMQTKNDIVHFFGTPAEKIAVVYQDCSAIFANRVSEVERATAAEKYILPQTYILTVGTIEKRKDQLTVLKAFAQLKDPACHLVLVGRHTSYIKELLGFIEEEQLRDRVKLISDVSQADLPAIYQLATLCVYASEFEGFGIPVLEAMRSHVPVIAANTSSLPEVGGDAAVYFDHGNVSQLAEKMNLLLIDGGGRSLMAEKSLLQVAKFDAARLIAELEGLYR